MKKFKNHLFGDLYFPDVELRLLCIGSILPPGTTDLAEAYIQALMTRDNNNYDPFFALHRRHVTSSTPITMYSPKYKMILMRLGLDDLIFQPMTAEEDAEIKAEIIDFLYTSAKDAVESNRIEVSHRDVRLPIVTLTRKINWVIQSANRHASEGRYDCNFYYKTFIDDLMNDPRLTDDVSVYNDLRPIFDYCAKQTVRGHALTKIQLAEKVLTFIQRFKLAVRPDFITYYTALADEYDFTPKYKNLMMFIDTSDIGVVENGDTRRILNATFTEVDEFIKTA